MSLLDKIFLSGTWQNTNNRYSNTAGTPIVSVAESGDGRLIADEYTLTLSAVAGGTGTVTVTTATPNNPYSGRVVTGVVLNGATASTTVVPGLSIVFNAASANGNVGIAFGGTYLGVFDAEGVGAGTPSAGVRHQVTNTGTGPVSDAKARLTEMAIGVRKTGVALDYLKPFAQNATEKIVGGGSDKVMPYELKVISVSGSGGAKVGTLQVDGATVATDYLMDLTTGTLTDGVNLKAISPAYGYRFVDGPLEGLEFALSASVATNDIANVLIFSPRFVQIAPDVSGSEGTYGTTDVDLTEAGQSTGVIQASAVAYYWTRILVPVGGVAEANPYPAFVSLEASETESAGWTA